MKSWRFLLIVLLLAMSSLACFSTSTQTPVSKTLFSDDFSNPSKKWDRVSDSSGTTDYYNNSYRITVNITNYDAWANPDRQSFIDTRIEVDATKHSGPDDNDFGVICRYSNEKSFYYGIISSDGYYGILKMTSDNGKNIGHTSMLESDKINQGAATNHIRFDCVGSTLTLYVNGFKLDQQTDQDYTAGNVGLLAGTFGTVGTDILFNNFIVYKP